MENADSPGVDDRTRIGRRLVLYGVGGGISSVLVPAGVVAQEDEEGNGAEEEAADEEDEEAADEEDEAENGEAENGEEENGAENGGTETVEIDDNFFEPESLTIEPGTTVEWVWVGSADHNVEPESVPDGAEWEGHPDLQSDGEYDHTFDVEGTYEYICVPHVGVGMVGSIEVDPDAAAAGEAGPADVVPDAATTLVVATVVSMVAVLSLSYAFLKFGGTAK